MLDTKERVEGHYEVTTTLWATVHVWVEDEEVERRLLDEILHPWHASYTA